MQRQRDIFNGSILEIYHESTKNWRRLLIVTSATLYYNTARSRGLCTVIIEPILLLLLLEYSFMLKVIFCRIT